MLVNFNKPYYFIICDAVVDRQGRQTANFSPEKGVPVRWSNLKIPMRNAVLLVRGVISMLFDPFTLVRMCRSTVARKVLVLLLMTMATLLATVDLVRLFRRLVTSVKLNDRRVTVLLVMRAM